MAEEQLSFQERTAQRLEAEYAGDAAPKGVPPVEASDLEETPDLTAESEVAEDDAVTTDGTEESESDLEEAPEEEESENTDWEKRYKDSQIDIQESREAVNEAKEELSRVRSEESDTYAQMTSARFELEDRTKQSEQIAQYWANMAQADVQRARSINFAQVPPEQVAQAQQWQQAAEIKYQQTQQALNHTIEQGKKLREESLAREAAISRARLTRDIPNFDDVYPELGKFAVEQGVNPEVFKEIVDPGLIGLINRAMNMSATPDIIETTKQTKAKAPKARSTQDQPRSTDGKYKKVDQAFKKSRNPKERAALWEERAKLRLAKERQR
jgi:hypothetical protein